MKSFLLSIVAAAAAGRAAAQVTGEAFGFAAGTTGGGDAKPEVPSTNEELVKWLTDDQPRVIMVDRLFDFLETEGSTKGSCCRDERLAVCDVPGRVGQVYIGDDCGDMEKISCTYWNSPREPIYIKSNKSLVGVGDKGVIRGKGFRLSHDVSNIILQNIHITELNPEYIWGGDAISLDGTDRVWIDHCKTSLIGRQHIVSGWGPAGAVTISHHEFDGKTSFSCDQKHYYNALLIGERASITFAYNYLHDVSGRAPNVGGTEHMVFQGVNNLWEDVDGHAFAIGDHIQALVEGNHFEDAKQPIEPGTYKTVGEVFFVETKADAAECEAFVGRACEMNTVGGKSGELSPLNNTAAIEKLKNLSKSLVKPMGVDKVPAFVKANAGIGKLKTADISGSAAGTSVVSEASVPTAPVSSVIASYLSSTTAMLTPACNDKRRRAKILRRSKYIS